MIAVIQSINQTGGVEHFYKVNPETTTFVQIVQEMVLHLSQMKGCFQLTNKCSVSGWMTDMNQCFVYKILPKN